ncbi:MAG: hypothetical protein ABSE84_18765 [Isosphaeraceae bacterium]
MGELPAELPADILHLLDRPSGQGVDGAAMKAASQEIARRYGVTQIEGLRAVHYVLGGVAPNARLYGLPPDTVASVDRPAAQRRFRIELRRAPAGSSFRDEYKLVEVDMASGKEENTVHWSWEEATAQAQSQFGVDPDEWRESAPSG